MQVKKVSRRLEAELLFRKYLRRPYRLEDHRDARFCAIVQSYKRPQNINRIVRILLACEFIDHVIVTNNNPDIDLRPYLGRAGDRLTLVQQTEKRPPAWRYEIAAQHPDYNWFISLDDDVFPFPKQLGLVITGLLENPIAPAGCFAEYFEEGRLLAGKNVEYFEQGCIVNSHDREGSCLRGQPRSLMWVYAFSKDHLRKYTQRLQELSLSNRQQFSDDVILSMAGGYLPSVIPVGPLLRCHTSDTAGIANYKEPDFHNDRLIRYQESMQWLDNGT